VEGYIREHSDADFTHGICPECLEKVRPKLESGRGVTRPSSRSKN